ncbi:MAG: TadE/TadG family type IV pilus assembly protein [Candidatus Binatia bacterium]
MRFFRNTTKENSRGSTALELSLAMPMMLAVTCGLVEFGSAFELRQKLVSVADEAARVGTQSSCPRPSQSEVLAATNAALAGAGLLPSLATVVLVNAGGESGTDMLVDVSYDARFPLLSTILNWTGLQEEALAVSVHVEAENE